MKLSQAPKNWQAGTSTEREELKQALTIRAALIQEKPGPIQTIKDNPNKLKLYVIITKQ